MQASEPKRIDVRGSVDLSALAEDVQSTDEPRILRRGDEDVAVVLPITREKEGAFGADDPIWNIVGVDGADGPRDVARNKHRYLAEAYTRTRTASARPRNRASLSLYCKHNTPIATR